MPIEPNRQRADSCIDMRLLREISGGDASLERRIFRHLLGVDFASSYAADAD